MQRLYYSELLNEYLTTWGIAARLVVLLLMLITFYRELYYLTDKLGPDYNQDYRLAENLMSATPLYYTSYADYQTFSPSERQAAINELGTAHPPTTGVFFIPFLLFDYHSGYMLQAAISMNCIVVSVFLMSRLLSYSSLYGLLLALAALWWGPCRDGFEYGQVSPWLASLVVSSWFLAVRGSNAFAGLALGLAGALKLYPLLGLVVFLGTRNWSAIFYTLLGFLSVFIIGVSLEGLDAWFMYFNVVAPQNVAYWVGFPPVVSIPGLIAPLVAESRWSMPFIELPWLVPLCSLMIVGLGSALLLYLSLNDRTELKISYLAVMLGMCLLAPVSHPHGLLLVWPCVLYLLKNRDSFSLRLLLSLTMLITGFTQVGWWAVAHEIGVFFGLPLTSPFNLYLVKLHAAALLLVSSIFLRHCYKELLDVPSGALPGGS